MSALQRFHDNAGSTYVIRDFEQLSFEDFT